MSDGYTIPSAAGITPEIGVDLYRGARAQTKQAARFKQVQMDSMRRAQTLAEVQVMIGQRQFATKQEFNERQLDAQIQQNKNSLGVREQELNARLLTLRSTMDSRALRDEEFRDRIKARQEFRVHTVARDKVADQKAQLTRYDVLRRNPQVRRAAPGEVAPVGFHREEFVGVQGTAPLIVPDQFKDPVAERQVVGKRERSLQRNVSTALSAIRVYGARIDRHTGSYNKMGEDLTKLQSGVGAKFRVEPIKAKQRQMAELKRKSIDPIQAQFDAAEDRWLEANESLRRYQQGAVEEPDEPEPTLVGTTPGGPATTVYPGQGEAAAPPPDVVAPVSEERRRLEMGRTFGEIDAAFEKPSPKATDRGKHEAWYAKVRPELLTMLGQALPLAQTEADPERRRKALALIEQLNDDIAKGLTHPDEVSLAMGLLRDFINQQGAQ